MLMLTKFTWRDFKPSSARRVGCSEIDIEQNIVQHYSKQNRKNVSK